MSYASIKAKELLTHYIGHAVPGAEAAEVENIVDYIIDAAVEEMERRQMAAKRPRSLAPGSER